MIEVEVVRILEGGSCPFGLTPGDIFQIDERTPDGLCHWAYMVILPFATTLRFGGNIPWEEKGVCSVCCPDPKNPVVFKIRRVNTC